MRQSITTKYIGPTNFRGSRIKATAEAGSVTLPYDHALNSEQNHCAAARALAAKFDWRGVWVVGASNWGCHYVWIGATGYDATNPSHAFEVK